MRSQKVQCWIYSSDGAKVLLLKLIVERGGFWQPVTGGVEEGESFAQGAAREAFEETGFSFATPALDTGHEFEFESRFGPARERVFAFKVDGTPAPTLDPREHNEFKWIAPKDAGAMLRYPSNIEGLIKTYRLAFGKDLGETS